MSPLHADTPALATMGVASTSLRPFTPLLGSSRRPLIGQGVNVLWTKREGLRLIQ